MIRNCSIVSTPSAVVVRPSPWRVGDALDDQPAVARVGRVGDERLVDLDLGEGQLAKLHQRGIAGPEVVDRKADSLDPEAGQRIHHLDQRLGRALGQLEHDAVGGYVERPAHPLDQVGEVEVLETERGNVESDAGVDALLPPFEPLPRRIRRRPQ